jgi:hypothetical protein
MATNSAAFRAAGRQLGRSDQCVGASGSATVPGIAQFFATLPIHVSAQPGAAAARPRLLLGRLHSTRGDGARATWIAWTAFGPSNVEDTAGGDT